MKINDELLKYLREQCKYYLKEVNGCFVYDYWRQNDEDYFNEDIVCKIANEEKLDNRIELFESEIYDELWSLEYKDYLIKDIIKNFCEYSGYEGKDTEIQDILEEIIEINYDTYLDVEYKVNIVIDFDRQDYNTEFSNSTNLETCKNNNLYTLLRKQGYTKKDYLTNCKLIKDKDIRGQWGYIDYNKVRGLGANAFLTSIKEEIDDYSDNCLATLVVLKSVTLRDLIYNNKFVINKGNKLGLFNWCWGCCGALDIQLDKDFEIDREKDIYFIQVEGTDKGNHGYSVNEVCGLIGSCWKE